MTPSEFKKAMQKMNKLYDKLDKIYNNLPNEIQYEMADFHHENYSVAHSIRWGQQGTQELLDDADRFIKNLSEKMK